jgi:hypothetical protein
MTRPGWNCGYGITNPYQSDVNEVLHCSLKTSLTSSFNASIMNNPPSHTNLLVYFAIPENDVICVRNHCNHCLEIRLNPGRGPEGDLYLFKSEVGVTQTTIQCKPQG